tara:strand:- start:272 stop:472 length:201 start_codon:yes stop_codon:yes gene_type:complete
LLTAEIYEPDGGVDAAHADHSIDPSISSVATLPNIPLTEEQAINNTKGKLCARKNKCRAFQERLMN